MKIAVFKMKSVYGKDLIYPINELAMKFAKLIGKKTLLPNELEQISELGFEVICLT